MTRNFISHLCLLVILALLGPGSTSVALADQPAADQPAADQPAADQPAADQPEKPANSILAAIKSQTIHAPENLTVGQPLQLEIVVEHSPGTRVDIPHALQNTRWDLIDSHQSEVATEGAITTTFSLNFAIFRPGQARLPALTLRILAPDGTHTELQTEKVTVLVRSAIEPGETPPFAPPRDPVAIWTHNYTAAWIGGFILSVALLAGLVIFAMRRRKITADTMPVRSAHEVVMEKLRNLENSALLDQGEVMIYYVRMSEAIREYLGRRFDFPGTELTTAEINAELTRMKSRWPRGIALEDVKRWLEHCDFVKFSGAAPSADAARNSLERAFGIVELTRRQTEIVIPQDPPTPASTPEAPQANSASPAPEEAAAEETGVEETAPETAIQDEAASTTEEKPEDEHD